MTSVYLPHFLCIQQDVDQSLNIPVLGFTLASEPLSLGTTGASDVCLSD